MENVDSTLLKIVQDYLTTIEDGESVEKLASFYAEDIEQVEFPNALTKQTAKRTLTDIKTGFTNGKRILTKQRFEIRSAFVVKNGQMVILELTWRGTLAIPLGKIPAGGELVANFSQYIEFNQDKKIYRQRNYDCFEPF